MRSILWAVAFGLSLFVLAGPAAGQEEIPAGGTFFDDDGSVHEGAIEAIAHIDVTRGCREPDFFCPDHPVTRGQMAAFLFRGLGLRSEGGDPFEDDDDSIFETEIGALAAAGITRGCDSVRFCPDDPVTRGQMAAFLARAFSLPRATTDVFVDDDGHLFEKEIEALVAAGVTRGCDPPANRSFCPDRAVTRAEMATFLARILGLPLVEVPERPSLTVAFAGDILIHAPIWRQAARHGHPFDFGPMFEPVSHLIEGADLAICHLEVPLSHDNRGLSGYPTFNAPREVARAVVEAGFDGCSTASNHSFDQGKAGIRSTLATLEEYGLGQAGMARSAEEAERVTTYQVGDVEIAHLSATWWLNGFRLPRGEEFLVQDLDVEDLERRARKAREEGADIMVVSMHCCVEYVTQPTQYQRETAMALIASPHIDLVVGHHAHVVQPVAEVGGKVVLYGLGNFLSAQRSRPATQDGVIVEVEFARRTDGWWARQVTAHPTWVEGGTFRILPAGETNQASWRRTRSALGTYLPSLLRID